MGDSTKTRKQRSKEIRPTEETHQGERCDLLIVDDEENLRVFLGMIIHKKIPNLRIQYAGNGLEGLEKAKAFRPRIVWTCIRMPRMDGLEMIKLIRQNPDLQNTRIIVGTGYGSEEIRNQAFELGADRFLHKPFTPEEALGAVAGLLK